MAAAPLRRPTVDVRENCDRDNDDSGVAADKLALLEVGIVLLLLLVATAAAIPCITRMFEGLPTAVDECAGECAGRGRDGAGVACVDEKGSIEPFLSDAWSTKIINEGRKDRMNGRWDGGKSVSMGERRKGGAMDCNL